MRTRPMMTLFLIEETRPKQKTFSDRSDEFKMISTPIRIPLCDLLTMEQSVDQCDASCSAIWTGYLLSRQMFARQNAISPTPGCSSSVFRMPKLTQIALQISLGQVLAVQ